MLLRKSIKTTLEGFHYTSEVLKLNYAVAKSMNIEIKEKKLMMKGKLIMGFFPCSPLCLSFLCTV